MPSDSYPFAVGRVKLLENGLLDRSKLARLNELTLPEAVRALSDWGYAADYPVKNDIDGMVAFRRRELRSVIDEVTPDKELTDLFYLETDATNFKLLLKYRMLGGYGFDHADLQSGLFPIDVVRNCVESRNYSELGEPLAEKLQDADEALRVSVNPRTLSANVDNAFFAYIFTVLARKKNKFCTSYFRRKVDYINIISVLRSRALHWDKSEFEPMIVPGGTISRETLLYSVECEQENLAPTLAPSWNGEEVEERDTDQVRAAIDLCHSGSLEDARAALAAKLDDMAERRRFDSFGIGPIVCFLLAGENECRALRVLFAKKRAAQQKA